MKLQVTLPPLFKQPAAADAGPSPDARAVVRGKALVLFNPKAGGVAESDRERLVGLLDAAGFSDYAIVGPDVMGERLFKQARGFDVMIVLGGDGTARSVAAHAPLWGAPPLILLPGGTLNVLPRALYGDLAWPEALTAALERGVVRRLSYGKANEEPFFVAAIFGEPTLLARAREAVREGRPIAAWRRFRHFTKRVFTRRLRARVEGQPAHTAEAIGVLCPSFSGQVEGEGLEWVRLTATHLLALVRLGLKSFGTGWREDPAVELQTCRRGDIVSLGFIPATLDGEPKTFLSRVRINFVRRGPHVIALDPEEA